MDRTQREETGPPLLKTQTISIPRSGHHLMVNLLFQYFSPDGKAPHFQGQDARNSIRKGIISSGRFHYCEYYSHCKSVPCSDPRTNYSKNHDFGRHLPPETFPRLIVQIRHPLASIISYFQFKNLILPNPDNAAEFRQMMASAKNYWRHFIHTWVLDNPNPEKLVIRYETLIGQPQETLAKVLAYLDPETPLNPNRLTTIIQAEGISPNKHIQTLMPWFEQDFRAWEKAHQDEIQAAGIALLFS